MNIYAPFVLSAHPEILMIEGISYFQVPYFRIIGLPNAEIDEARDRIRAAFHASAWEFPRRNIVINLAPAHLPKRGTGLDLSMALTVKNMDPPAFAGTSPRHSILAWGELALNGDVRPAGRVPAVLEAASHQEAFVLLAPEDHKQALKCLDAFGPKLPRLDRLRKRLCAVRNLNEAWACALEPRASSIGISENDTKTHGAVSLLPLAKPVEDSVIVALAGFHHLLLVGPKGSGKSYALKWLEHLAPPSDIETQWQALVAQSARTAELNPTIEAKSVRRINPSVRPAALLGQIQATGFRAGELTLAHEGILVADEFAEWPRDSRECLRGPLETGNIQLQRAHQSLELKSHFLFVGTSNFCGCGGYPLDLGLPPMPAGTPRCRCAAHDRRRYWAKLSGPILDRLDLVSVVLSRDEAHAREPKETDRVKALQTQLERTRTRLVRRGTTLPGRWSSERTEAYWKEFATANPRAIPDIPNVSRRSRHKTIRIAATLAALDQVDWPSEIHWRRAFMYRPERWFADVAA